MRKYYLAILTIILVIGIIGCSQESGPLADLNDDDIKAIEIRTTMTEGSPQEKVITEKDEINKVIEFIKSMEYSKKEKQEDIKGWGFWLVFDGWDDISYIGKTARIGEVEYETNIDNAADRFMNIYESLKSPAQKYPN